MHRSRWEGVRCPGAPREIEALNLHGKINKIRPPPPPTLRKKWICFTITTFLNFSFKLSMVKYSRVQKHQVGMHKANKITTYKSRKTIIKLERTYRIYLYITACGDNLFPSKMMSLG